jgi:hypothetical protein
MISGAVYMRKFLPLLFPERSASSRYIAQITNLATSKYCNTRYPYPSVSKRTLTNQPAGFTVPHVVDRHDFIQPDNLEDSSDRRRRN